MTVIKGNKKQTKITVLIISVILLIILGAYGSNAYGQYEKSSQYHQALTLLRSQKWQEAENILTAFNGYKDSKTLITYAEAEKTYTADNKDFDHAIVQLNDIPTDYNGDLQNSINTFRQTLEQKSESTIIDNVINTGISLIHQEKYMQAFDELNTVTYPENATIKNLNAYATARGNTSENVESESAYLDPDYNGPIADEIKAWVLKYTTMDKWREEWSTEQAIEQGAKEYSEKSDPSIGMTKDEVLNSRWGKPDHINTTQTAYGTSEQWVYSEGYIYFDNGVVTAIQK